MLEEDSAKLLEYERKNAAVFQVMGSLKLLNIKVKNFVLKLERVNEQDDRKINELNTSFRRLSEEVQFFQEEFKCFVALNIHVASVDTFSKNANQLFARESRVYTYVEMRRISVYLYRIADVMVKELQQWKTKNEERIHEIHARNGKYYFNRD